MVRLRLCKIRVQRRKFRQNSRRETSLDFERTSRGKRPAVLVTSGTKGNPEGAPPHVHVHHDDMSHAASTFDNFGELTARAGCALRKGGGTARPPPPGKPDA